MGIRFYCPNGHKLNVKEFQAGRRGICPFCGARTQIPTQSTRPSSKSSRHAAAGHQKNGPAAGQTTLHDDDDAQASDSSPDILPGEPPSLPGDPEYALAEGGKMLGPSTAPDVPSTGPVTAPPATGARRTGFSRNMESMPPKGGTTSAAAAQPSAPFPSVATVLAGPTAPAAGPASKPAPGPTRSPGLSPNQATAASPSPQGREQTAAPATPAAAAPSSPSARAEPPDAIAEAPEMIWYIRPPTGGQFGPAPGEMMRSWISEGRVSADSLVWREGWRDWQEAGTVFPKLRSNQLMDLLETAPVAPVHPAGHASAARAHRSKSNRSADRSQVALLAVLIFAVVVLAVVFVIVLMHQ